ncbi:hypothetical protein K457DRAFT_17404 [Linnemannia elongata AG-77]|uniref:Uncharacterized protein n=1 Tax=Linnemannia elongata AG-77 TaxID=1314771 RepID=A0A197K276_9FUNG|nr:hypothetical protein K457DRAFT_17404 [Linnemannia elongata AG-77]
MRSMHAATIGALGANPLHNVSAASFTKSLFYGKYYRPAQYPLYRLSKEVHEFITSGYSGERCEVFIRGRIKRRGKVYSYNFTFAYVYEGAKPPPYGVPKYRGCLESIPKGPIVEYLAEQPSFYRVTILTSPRDRLPLHGVFHEHRLVFPYITASTGHVFFSEEIRFNKQKS